MESLLLEMLKNRSASLGWTGLGVISSGKGTSWVFSKALVYDSKVLLMGAFYDCHFLKLVNSVALLFSPLNSPQGFN